MITARLFAAVTQCLRCGLVLLGSDPCPRCNSTVTNCLRCGSGWHYRDAENDPVCMACGHVQFAVIPSAGDDTRRCACGRPVRRQQADVCNACYMRGGRAVRA